MDRLRQVAQLWNWLPAFRVVAETQHLPTASEALGVSPSALSRTIGLLEEELGQPLFRRVGRRLELNEAGERLLVATRDAMRRVHGSLELVQREHIAGPVRISSVGAVGPAHLVHALAELKARHPQLVPSVVAVSNELVVSELLVGRIDLALTTAPVRHPRVLTEHIGDLANGLYCGSTHPLAAGPEVSGEQGASTAPLSAVVEHEFCVPTPDPRGLTHEGWPATVSRKVGAELSQMSLGMHLCATGRFLAVLPHAVVERAPGLGLCLVEVADLELSPTPLFAVRRPPLAEADKAGIVLETLRSMIDAATGG